MANSVTSYLTMSWMAVIEIMWVVITNQMTWQRAPMWMDVRAVKGKKKEQGVEKYCFKTNNIFTTSAKNGQKRVTHFSPHKNKHQMMVLVSRQL